VRALVWCLTPEEVCQAAESPLLYDVTTRRAILDRIMIDLQDRVQDCHRLLVDSLLERLDSLPEKHRRARCSCLCQLFAYLPEDKRWDIAVKLLQSRYTGMRRKAYRTLSKSWSARYGPLVSAAYEKHKEFDCARLIADTLPVEYLQLRFSDLEQTLLSSGPEHIAKLYLRVGEGSVDKLQDLEEVDEITYAYVCAKLQRPLKKQAALGIFERNRLDSRVGLLIWSYGRMGLWSVLKGIAARAEDLAREKTAAILDGLGVHGKFSD